MIFSFDSNGINGCRSVSYSPRLYFHNESIRPVFRPNWPNNACLLLHGAGIGPDTHAPVPMYGLHLGSCNWHWSLFLHPITGFLVGLWLHDNQLVNRMLPAPGSLIAGRGAVWVCDNETQRNSTECSCQEGSCFPCEKKTTGRSHTLCPLPLLLTGKWTWYPEMQHEATAWGWLWREMQV